MQTTTMQTQRSLMVPASSLLTLHRPRLTCVSILTQPTAVPTVAAAPTSLTYRASTTTEPLRLLDQHGTLISPDSPTMGRARVPARTFATRSKLRIQTTLRPGEPYEDLAVELNQGSTTQYLKLLQRLSAGYTLGAVETSFTIQAWVKPTDCENPTDLQQSSAKCIPSRLDATMVRGNTFLVMVRHGILVLDGSTPTFLLITMFGSTLP